MEDGYHIEIENLRLDNDLSDLGLGYISLPHVSGATGYTYDPKGYGYCSEQFDDDYKWLVFHRNSPERLVPVSTYVVRRCWFQDTCIYDEQGKLVRRYVADVGILEGLDGHDVCGWCGYDHLPGERQGWDCMSCGGN